MGQSYRSRLKRASTDLLNPFSEFGSGTGGKHVAQCLVDVAVNGSILELYAEIFCNRLPDFSFCKDSNWRSNTGSESSAYRTSDVPADGGSGKHNCGIGGHRKSAFSPFLQELEFNTLIVVNLRF